MEAYWSTPKATLAMSVVSWFVEAERISWMPVVWQLMLQNDGTKVDLGRSNDQVLEYLFKDVKRQVQKAAATLLLFLPGFLRLVESNDWGCSCVEQDEMTIVSLAASLCSRRTLRASAFHIIVPTTAYHFWKIAYSVQRGSHIRSN
jgi:hypothetical protein